MYIIRELFIFSEVDVCGVPADRQVEPAYNLIPDENDCLPNGYCLDDDECYYPKNHIYGKINKEALSSPPPP